MSISKSDFDVSNKRAEGKVDLDPSTSLTFGGATHGYFQCHLTEVFETFLPGTRKPEITQPAAPFSGSVASMERHCINPKAPWEMVIFTIGSL